MPLTLRTLKGAPLTNAEVDGNFTYLDDKIDSEVDGVRTVALNAEAAAEAAQAAAETAQDSALNAEAGAQAAQLAAEAARDDAVAVVYSGDASLDPAPGKIPVARAGGEIDAAWVGATELPSIKPSLLLDFANSKVVDPRIMYACASPMPYYDGKTVVKAEENLLLYSQDFSNAAWVKFAGTIPSASELAPDNTLTGSVLAESVSGRAELTRSFSVVTGLPYSLSIFAKENPASAKRYIVLATGSGGFGGQSVAIFDLATGTKTFDNGGGTYTITEDDNGYWRITNTDVATSTASSQFIVYTSDNGTTASSAGGGSVIIWGAQLEQRAFATAYTPTTTQPITRYQPKLLEAPANVPTITHDPVTGEFEGLQVYGQATNRALWARDFSNAAWVKTNVGVTTGQIGLDGTNAACLLTAQAANSTIIQDLGTVASALKTGEVYLKRYRGTGAVEITLNGGTTWTPVTITSTGYTKVRITGTLADEDFGIRLAVSGDAVFADYGGVYTGDYAGPPIKTEGSQVTRAAVTITPHAGSGVLGEGALYAEYSAASAIANIGTAAIGAPADRDSHKTAVAFDATSTITVTDNGAAATTAGSTGASALTVGQVNGTLEKIAVYPQKITATEAGALTS